MKKHVRKIFSWILVLCMTFSSLSLNAFAAEPETSAPVSAEEKMQQNSITEESSEEISNTSENTTEVSSDTTEDPTTESTAEAGSDTTEDSTTESTSEAKSGTTQAVKSQSSEISGESTDQTEGETSEAATSEATAEDGTSENGLNALALEDYEASIASLTMGTKPSDGTTTGNPFVKGTAGSNSFRIPAMVTLDNGTIVAAADARWNTTYDGGGLDTIASYSKDSGANWNYTFANYLGDNGNTYNGSGSTAFIDPALATDGETVYMLTDLYPYGVALNGSGNTAPSTSVGFNDDGTLKLAESGSSSYNYYLKDGQIYDSSKNVVSGYTVDAYFNITGDDCDTNLFFSDSPYQVVRTGYLYLTKSTDGGATWSEPTLIPNVKTSSEQVCLVGPGRGLVTNDGTIVFPIYSYNGSSYSQEMGFIYSTDNGATWTRSDSSTSMWSSESAVVELNDGTLRFFFRNGQSSLYYVDYYTSSSHWDTPVDTGIATNSNTQISAIKYSKTVDGKQVILVSCPTGSGSSGSSSSSASARLNGKIFVGYVNTDNTISWQSDKAISVTSNDNQFMYSCLTELSDGKIAILYENKESAWGTGDNCYYTMDFETYDFPATADSGTETEPEGSATITDETTGTVVKTSDGTVLTKMDVVANTDVAGLEGRTYVAYDITLNDGKYTGAAAVSIVLPENMQDYTADELTGFTVNDDGTITETKGTLKDGVYTFTAPHFSTQGVATLSDLTVKDIELTVGESKTVTDNSGNYADAVPGADASIATVTVEGNAGQEEKVTYTEASVTCSALLSSNSDSWTAAKGYYYTPDGTNYYPVYAMRSETNRYTYTWGYSTTDSSDNVERISTQTTRYPSYYRPDITVYTKKTTTETVDPYTTITFTGVSAGTTTAIVGSTQYNITVKRKSEEVSIAVDGSATYTDSTAASGVTNSDASVVKTAVSDGKITLTGLKEGTATVTTPGVVYNVTVNDGTPIRIKENKTTTISVTLEDGQTVTWSSSDNNYVGVAGKYDTSVKAYTNEAILAGQNVTDSPVTVIATIKDADGNVVGTQKWLVTVTEGDADINTTSKDIYFNIDTIEHCTVYYSINGGELIPVNGTGVSTGEWTGNGTYTGHFNIMFFAAPDDGYALTYMSISGSADQYYTLSNGNPDGTGSDAWPFNDAAASTIPSSSSDSAWKIVNGSLHGFRWALLEGNMTIDQMKVMFSNAIALGCDGATTITKNEADGMGSASSPTVCKFVAQKLPTVEKTIESITRKDSRNEAYTDGMKVEVGDTINYSVVVTRYATNSTYGTITYDNEKLTDELTNNNGISNPDLGTSTTTDKTYDYTTSLTVTYDNFKDVVTEGSVTNTAEFSCNYSSYYSVGILDTTASAVAEIEVETVNYVVDFGLPLTIDLSDYIPNEDTSITGGTATYGDITVSGKTLTYTPNTMLKGIDHVTLTFSNNQSYGLNIVPATTVYYEEGFATVSGFTGGSKGIGTQTKSVAGRHTDDKIYHYGYDVKYANELTGASNGTEAVSTTKGSTAEFSFKGTGIDIFANCASDTGNVLIQLSKTDGTPVKLMVVQTAAKGAYGNLVAKGAYNSVIASVKGLEHGDYKVKITTTTADPVKLDGFRVYGTLADEETNAVYTSDLEENPSFFNLRDAVLTDLNANSGTSSASVYAQVYEKLDGKIDGAVVLSNSELNPVDDTETLLNEGPKKEIYLKNNQSLVFRVNTNRKLELGLKAVNDAVTFTINSSSQKINITSDTDMFYEITKTSDGTVTITNNSDAILSVTNLKICDDPNAAFGTLTEDDFNDALVQMGLIDSSESDKTDADKEEDKNIPTKPESGKEDDKNTPSKPESGKETVKKPDKGSSNKTTGVKTPKKVTVKKVASPKKGQMKITWKKVSGASGYEILLATNKAFTKNRKTVVVKGKTKLSKVVKGLKKGRKYYVKVRAYTTAGKKVVKGKYSSRCSVRTKK